MLWRAHDHHRDLPTLDATARATGCSRTNRDGDAVTRHGLSLHRIVALWHPPSIPCAPIGSPALFSLPIPTEIARFVHQPPRIGAPVARLSFRHADAGWSANRPNHLPQHSQILKSP